jgi:hypothetical protein
MKDVFKKVRERGEISEEAARSARAGKKSLGGETRVRAKQGKLTRSLSRKTEF